MEEGAGGKGGFFGMRLELSRKFPLAEVRRVAEKARDSTIRPRLARTAQRSGPTKAPAARKMASFSHPQALGR